MISERYLELLRGMEELHRTKNAGYSGKNNPDPWANFRRSQRIGVNPLQSALVRMNDKYERLMNILEDPTNEQVGEGPTDTLLDLSSYALIALCLYEEQLISKTDLDETAEDIVGVLYNRKINQ